MPDTTTSGPGSASPNGPLLLAGLAAAATLASQFYWIPGSPLRFILIGPGLAGLGTFLAARLLEKRRGEAAWTWLDRLGNRFSSPARLTLLTFLFFLTVYCFFAGGRLYSSDDLERFRTVQSLNDRGSFVIGHYPDGRPYYTKYGPVQAFLALPLDALGRLFHDSPDPEIGPRRVAVSYFMQLVSALTSALLLALFLELGFGPRTALITTAIYGLGSIAWPYSKYFFTEPLTGFFLVAVFYCLVRIHHGRQGRVFFYCGLGLGLGGLNSTLVFIVAGPIAGLVLIWTQLSELKAGNWSRVVARLLAFGLPVLVFAVLMLIFNDFRYGSPWLTGYEGDSGWPNPLYDGSPGFSHPLWLGLVGLLLSPGKSIFLYSPVLIPVLLAWPGFVRRHGIPGLTLTILTAAWILLYAKWWAWHGDVCWGPRYTVPLTPLLCVPLALMVDRARDGDRLAGVALGIAFLIGLVIQMAAISVPFDIYWAESMREDYYNLPAFHYIHDQSPLLNQFRIWAAYGDPDFILHRTNLSTLIGPLAAILGWLLLLATRSNGSTSRQ